MVTFYNCWKPSPKTSTRYNGGETGIQVRKEKHSCGKLTYKVPFNNAINFVPNSTVQEISSCHIQNCRYSSCPFFFTSTYVKRKEKLQYVLTFYSSLKIELYDTLAQRICMLRILSALLLFIVADTLTAVCLYTANWNDRIIAAN